MSQKLWNKANKKAKKPDEADLQIEYASIITELGHEEVCRKNEIIQVYLENKWDNIWILLELEYWKLMRVEGAHPRQDELEALIEEHDRAITGKGRRPYIVEWDSPPEPEVIEVCQSEPTQ
jgi:hypothetical protein